MLPQQAERRSMQRAARDHRERLRMHATNTRRRNVPTRRRLTQPERHYTIFEQRREPTIQKYLPLIELAKYAKNSAVI